VIEASWAQPYFSLRLDLDLAAVGAVMVEAPPLRPAKATKARAMAVSALDGTLLDAVVRLLRLLDTPRDAAFLAPLIQREIVYRLLVGEQGDLLRQIAVEGGETYRIARALARLRTEYDRPLRVEELAGEANMSASGFYHHFKAITGMSPLQYQKQHRLQEARRLLLGEHLDATTAAYRVGYDDVSQFNREYKRLFGSPPMRDMGRLRAVAQQGAALAAD
jgi:AraC-like DNA-binding protein